MWKGGEAEGEGDVSVQEQFTRVHTKYNYFSSQSLTINNKFKEIPGKTKVELIHLSTSSDSSFDPGASSSRLIKSWQCDIIKRNNPLELLKCNIHRLPWIEWTKRHKKRIKRLKSDEHEKESFSEWKSGIFLVHHHLHHFWRQHWPLLQLVVFQAELLDHFSPVGNIEDIVSTVLIHGCLGDGFNSSHTCQPHTLLLVVSPVTTIPVKMITQHEWILKRWDNNRDHNNTAVDLQFLKVNKE